MTTRRSSARRPTPSNYQALTDRAGRGQAFARAIIEAAGRLETRGSATLRWAPAHKGVEGNEVADGFAKHAAENVVDAVGPPRLTHLTRKTTEARAQDTRAWIASYVKSSRHYQPPKGSNLGSYRSSPASSPQATSLSSKRWWCGNGGRRRQRHHFFRCKA